ncbi:fungal-specific transcription factor domain-containing protein [Xylariomycetidae sp. FL0641]|nr:fungal-specific transcription factor domain-containing protein [Xylariomycetidae sp. FL0641]
MDAANVFRPVDGFGMYVPRMTHGLPTLKKPVKLEEPGENDGSHRIAHTLTACCRCRQRKTRCDPTLPRCLPCERSGSICEYFDTTKGKKISRYYVVKLQEKVRALEAELGQYTDDDDYPKNHEDYLRPGGLVSLNETDETPRYLGPSSGIAMSRILMEEAKRYTDSKRISELIPEVRVRRQAAGPRSMSFSMPLSTSRKKSYPMISAVAAPSLPSTAIANRLLEVFEQRAQVFAPIFHEQKLAQAVQDVYAGSRDPYQNFVVRLVMAISMQKLDATYAGLADSYYLAAMQYFEDVIRPKDLKTLQCLILIGQYSLLTPTRTAVYYVVGLATRICQQPGLADEKTIALDGCDPLTLDMRRRVSWAVISMELSLALTMGRPNGFAKSDDHVDLKFFETVADSNISEREITPGPPDEKKLVAVHTCKMRLLQAEIRRVLYEKKRQEPKDDRNPWFASMEAKMNQWLNTLPENPPWCRPWFTARYHAMIVMLHRPSPQVSRPSVQSANKCFDSAAFVIEISSKQMMAAAVDITWVFLLTLYMALNTLLWSVTAYADVRASHSREEVQELVNVALDIIDQCVDRWPGTAAASQLYSTFTKACLQSYESSGTPMLSSSLTTPPSQPDMSSPDVSEAPNAGPAVKGEPSAFNPPQFGYVFGSTPEEMNSYNFDGSFPPHPTFRSNSIFLNPASNDHTGRRFSYFPPDFTQMGDFPPDDPSPPPSESTTVSPPFMSPPQNVPTPPESIGPVPGATPTLSNPLLATPISQTQSLPQGSPDLTPRANGMRMNGTPQQQHQRPPQTPFTIPSHPPQHRPQGQRPLPPATTVTDWFNPPPPFISPYAFGGGGGGFWGDAPNAHGFGGGLQGNGFEFPRGLPPERQGSLSQAQQVELMDVLENEGMTDIDTYLNMGMAYDNTNNFINAGMNVNWGGRV